MRWWRGVVLRVSASALVMACACAEGPAPERVEAVTRALVLTASDAGGVGDAADVSAPSCCVPSDTPGCADARVAGCLCEIDPFCCNDRHDPLCVREAVSSCGLACGPPPAANDCCSASATPGCSEAAVLACVCELDPACCQLRFDQSCVNLAAARCGAVCANEEAP
jgi:hypothetical protein